MWLQNQRDMSSERNRSRRDDPHEFRLGRLKHERVKVPRGSHLLDWAMQVMHIHAERKSVLEIEFNGEDGTGLGPTLEFYALVAAEIQRKDLAMWLCDDLSDNNRYCEHERENISFKRIRSECLCYSLPETSNPMLLTTRCRAHLDITYKELQDCFPPLCLKTAVPVTKFVIIFDFLAFLLPKCSKTVV